ncbi:hypothetical protein [Bythopirellula goksoeyrii]|uniref:hypothetical protein n=1 Tax=Bythopirellula goksoeyrii TaxID=1400387 RepID=UPI0011CE9B00|nr:hypothetical protein [Bythopirellula goksoeyrii]
MATFFSLVSGLAAEPAFLDEMDGAAPVLRLAEKSSFQVVSQHIERDEHLTGSGAEVVQLRGPAGESAQLSFDIPSAPVIAELSIAATISSNRPGVQIAARVVLPRSKDSLTGRSRELLLRGGSLSRGMPGERLQLTELPQLLSEQTRIARIRAEDRIDSREAYVTQLVFLVPGGSGVTELIVDRVELDGIILEYKSDPEIITASTESILVEPRSKPATSDAKLVPREILNLREPRRAASPIQRIIRWQGEPFEMLKELGFNAIWLSRAATPTELSEAQRLGIVLVCPPPVENLATLSQAEEWDHVIAWDLGDLVATDDLEQVLRMKQLIRQNDPISSRTTVMTCEQLSRDVSRTTDALLLGRELLGSDLTLRDFVAWLGQRQRLARPGTPLWTTIPTQVCPQRAIQIESLQGKNGNLVPAGGSYDQLAAITSAAMSIRCRDYLFESYSSLASPDPETRQRARTLELLNLRLRLLTPWLAAGKIAGGARSTVPGLSAIVLQAERSHLLIPITWSRDFRSQQELHTSGPVSFVVKGVAESADVYLLSLAGAERVRHERTTGGLRISVDSLPPDSMIMLTSDAQAFSQVSQFLRSIAGRASRLRRDVVAQRLQQLEVVSNAKSTEEVTGVKQLLARCEGELAACDQDLQRGFVEQACRRSLAIERTLSQAEYSLRNDSQSAESQVVTPLIFGVDTISEERHLQEALSRATTKTHLLSGGEFEDLQPLLAQGWRHKQLPVPGITSGVRLSPEAPHAGAYCLELEARAIDPTQPISVISTAPVWITSAAIPVKAGEIVEIMGMARVPEELIGSVDGLEIIDSLGGAGMATRVKYAPSWQAFRILRCAPADTNLTVSLALSGLGRAQVDNLMVRSLQMPRELAGRPQSEEQSRQ